MCAQFVTDFGNINARMVLMQTVDREISFPVIVAENEAIQLMYAMTSNKFQRPQLYDLMVGLGEGCNVKMEEAYIYRLNEGVFYTRICYVSEETGRRIELESRVSDALILSFKYDCPVYIDSGVLERVGLPTSVLEKSLAEDDENEGKEPESDVTLLPKLEERLHEAVETENYEEAARLRDQISKLIGAK